MKNFQFETLFFVLFLFSATLLVTAQEITKYDYLEVIVIQKMANNGKVKRIKVEEQKSLLGKIITIKEMESLKSTSDLLNYMNIANWEFVERTAVPELNSPIWMSYIFRKKK